MRRQVSLIVFTVCVSGCTTVTPPPKALQLDPFYAKHVDAGGIPVVGSAQVPDAALEQAAELLDGMLARRPDLRKALAEGHVRVAVMSETEVTTDIPEHSKLTPKEYWDGRARGLGGTPYIPTTSCGAENLLGSTGDRYCGECILIHEFAHSVHEVGMLALDANFDATLQACYRSAMEAGLWKNTYAATNHKEYWAEGVQDYFDCNLSAEPANGVHNHICTREQLQEYDPKLAALVASVFRTSWRWTPNGAHRRCQVPGSLGSYFCSRLPAVASASRGK